MDTLKKAIETWGEEAQIDKAIEEMAELTKALLKGRLIRRNNIKDVSEEIADVLIMVEQLIMIYDNEDEVNKHTNSKISRMEQRLTNAFGQLREQEIPIDEKICPICGLPAGKFISEEVFNQANGTDYVMCMACGNTYRKVPLTTHLEAKAIQEIKMSDKERK
jgi:NTP pyrophosphatase (non-canonical NTP hydrolase)